MSKEFDSATVAHTTELDKLGARPEYGKQMREPGETDAHFRERLLCSRAALSGQERLQVTNTPTKWNRYRFKTRAEDYRPIVFDPRYPWWCSGEGEDGQGGYFIIVAYLPSTEPLSKYWDDAFDAESTAHGSIEFTDRFARPSYFVGSP